MMLSAQGYKISYKIKFRLRPFPNSGLFKYTINTCNTNSIMALILQVSVWVECWFWKCLFSDSMKLQEGKLDFWEITEFHIKVKGQLSTRWSHEGNTLIHPHDWKYSSNNRTNYSWWGDKKRSVHPRQTHSKFEQSQMFKFCVTTKNTITCCFVLLRQYTVKLLNATWDFPFFDRDNIGKTMMWWFRTLFCPGKRR